MKTLKKTVLLILTIVAFLSNTQAQPALKLKTHRAIKRTSIVILAAHKQVKERKVYTGNLARAIAHQKLARKMFRNGMYARAIHHSRRARMLAIMAIKSNKGTETAESKFTAEEDEIMKNSPSDDELEKELLKEEPNASMKDEDVIKSAPDVDEK